MKRNLLIATVLAFTVFAFPAMAQNFGGSHVCGLNGADAAMVKEQMMANRAEMRDFVRKRGAITYVPVRLHLVADNNGGNRVSERAALDMMCILNDFYLVHEIQFYLSGSFNYIDHSVLLDNPTSGDAYSKMVEEKVDNAINVFINRFIQSSGSLSVLAYYQPPVDQADWIVITKNSVYGSNVLAHEMGHFFSLSHPFFGWASEPYNESLHGNPVGNIAPDNVTENDRMDQSNCMIAADGICDTPPDFLFVAPDCGEFTEGIMDFNSEVIDPMEDNVMGYFPNCASYKLTPDQADAVHMSLESDARDYVNPGSTPSLEEIASVPFLLTPLNGSTVGYTSVYFSWQEVPGATRYLLEIDDVGTFVTSFPGKTLTNLEENVTYNWKVRPFSSLKTCTIFSQQFSFTTNDSPISTTEIASVENWLVRPNPIAKNNKLVIEMNSNEAFDAEIKVYTLTGQLLSTTNNTFVQGASTFEVTTNDLNTGMYIISVQSGKGVMNQKIVVR